MAGQLHRLDVDHSEHQAALLDAVRRGGAFAVQMVRLTTGDYLIDEEVLVERKTFADFAASLADGRLFAQAARLAHSAHRSILLIEDPTPAAVSAIHPHALGGRSSRSRPCGDCPFFIRSMRNTQRAFCGFSPTRRASRISTPSVAVIESRSALLRDGSLCSKACPASVRSWRIDYWPSSAQLKASSLPGPPR